MFLLQVFQSLSAGAWSLASAGRGTASITTLPLSLSLSHTHTLRPSSRLHSLLPSSLSLPPSSLPSLFLFQLPLTVSLPLSPPRARSLSFSLSPSLSESLFSFSEPIFSSLSLRGSLSQALSLSLSLSLSHTHTHSLSQALSLCSLTRSLPDSHSLTRSLSFTHSLRHKLLSSRLTGSLGALKALGGTVHWQCWRVACLLVSVGNGTGRCRGWAGATGWDPGTRPGPSQWHRDSDGHDPDDCSG